MKKDVVLLYKGDLSEIPLLIYLPLICLDLGLRVSVICGCCNSITKSELSELGIKIIALDSGLPLSKSTKLATLVYWVRFRKFVKSRINELPEECVFWLGSGDTAIALFGLQLNNPFVLHLHELYDEKYFYRKALKLISRHATAVVCPEKSRAAIFQVWFRLKILPYVLPNSTYLSKRYFTLMRVNEEKNELLLAIQNAISGRKVLLYQGHIGSDRCFLEFARAIGTLSDRWALVVMGKSLDETLDLLRIDCPDLIYVPYITPPGHLAVTSLASVGIIRYSPSSLNNIFCAPNKIWEYAKYGVPFISNKLPALENILCEYRCGACVEETQENILNELNKIECNYDDYSSEAKRLFDSVDLPALVKNIIQQCSY